jgi:predicted Zn-dependent peptidase
VLGMRGITASDPDRAALAVLDHVLGGGMSSRLFQTIREERGLVYSVFSEWVSYADAGAFSIYAGTAPSQVRDVISLIETELDQLLESGITADELTRAKRGFEGGMLLSLEDSASRMGRIGRSEMIYGRVPPITEFLDRLRAVELADVQRIAQRVLAAPRTLAVVGPFSKKTFAA